MSNMHFAVPSPCLYVFTSLNASLSLAVLADKGGYLEGSQTSAGTYGTCSLIQLAM